MSLCAPLFVASAPLLAPRVAAAAAAAATTSRCTRRAVVAPWRMSSVPPPPSRSSSSSSSSDDDHHRDDSEPHAHADARFARFSEFNASGGDVSVQNQLVSDALWAATRVVTTQNMESTIQMQIDAVSDMLSDLYSKSQRDMARRHEELAIRTSLPNISKWNQQLMQRTKASKLRRSQISKELAIVHALLKRTARSGYSKSPRSARGRVSMTLTPLTTAREMASATTPRTLQLFTLLLCACVLETFENVVAHEHGPCSLAQYSALGALFVACSAYVYELRHAHRRALHERQRRRR